MVSQVRPEELGVRQVNKKEAQAEAMAVSKPTRKSKIFWETKYFRKPEAQSTVEFRSGEEQEAGSYCRERS